VKPVGLFETLPPIAALQFVDARVGFVYATDKDGSVLLMKTTDGGETWGYIPSAVPASG
jgi:photosystem II stability/assembly factor-like uncharacterized protein